MEKKPGSRSGIRKNIPDYFSKSLLTVFRVKNTEIFSRGSGSGIRNLFDPGFEMFGSGKNIPDPQHCPRIFINF
jgi:hypothetical protein